MVFVPLEVVSWICKVVLGSKDAPAVDRGIVIARSKRTNLASGVSDIRNLVTKRSGEVNRQEPRHVGGAGQVDEGDQQRSTQVGLGIL